LNLETFLAENLKNYFYIMHLSYNGRERERLWKYAKEEELIGLDHPGKVYDDWKELRSEIIRDKRLPPIWIKQFDTICYQMKKGDIVVILEGWHSWLGIAEVTDDCHNYRPDINNKNNPRGFFDHIRNVRWRVAHEYGKQPGLPNHVIGFNNTLYRVEKGTNRWKLLATISW